MPGYSEFEVIVERVPNRRQYGGTYLSGMLSTGLLLFESARLDVSRETGAGGSPVDTGRTVYGPASTTGGLTSSPSRRVLPMAPTPSDSSAQGLGLEAARPTVFRRLGRRECCAWRSRGDATVSRVVSTPRSLSALGVRCRGATRVRCYLLRKTTPIGNRIPAGSVSRETRLPIQGNLFQIPLCPTWLRLCPQR